MFTKLFKEGCQAYTVYAALQELGNDLVVTLYGGEKPHIGAVAIAVPRSSLHNPHKRSASVSVITMTGHKEDELAKEAAYQLASQLNKKTVVVAGMHWDELPVEMVEHILANCRKVTRQIIGYLTGGAPGKGISS